MQSQQSSDPAVELERSTPVVLLVDDEPNVLHALTRSLRAQPYRIYTTRSAEEAMEIIKSRRVHLVVSDEHMPGLRGSDFLSWVAVEYPDIVRFVLTGQPDVPSAMRAINSGGVSRYFTKPCDVVELALAIRGGLEASTARAATANDVAP
jgi:DNA-binding NtrC family response regulator